MDPLLKLILEKEKVDVTALTDQSPDSGEKYLAWLDFLGTGKEGDDEITDKEFDEFVSKLIEQDFNLLEPDQTKNFNDKSKVPFVPPESEKMVISLLPNSVLKVNLKRLKNNMVEEELKRFSEMRFSEALVRVRRFKRFYEGVDPKDIEQAIFMSVRKELRIQKGIYDRFVSIVDKYLDEKFSGKFKDEDFSLIKKFLVLICANKYFSSKKLIHNILLRKYMIIARRGIHMNRGVYASVRFIISKSDSFTNLQKKLLFMSILVMLKKGVD